MLLSNLLEDQLGSAMLSELRTLEYAAVNCPDVRFAEVVRKTAKMFSASPKVLTSYKDFSKDPEDIGQPNLNEMGLHAFRVAYAHYAARRYIHNAEFLSQGLVVIPDALPEHEWEKVTDETRKVSVHSTRKLNTNCIPSSLNNALSILRIRVLGMFSRSTDLLKNLFNGRSFIQAFWNDPALEDVQQVAHSDIFFPALKWWYFPRQVQQGSFCYAKGSSNLTPSLLQWHHEQAIRASQGTYASWRTHGHGEGSLRIAWSELKDLGLKLERVGVAPNTLVIANVFGFHARHRPNHTVYRTALHGSVRIPRPFDIYLRQS